MPSQRVDSIARLLEEAETAHGEYELTVLGGVRDERWPDWYAAHLIDHGILAFLPKVHRSDATELATILAGLDASYRREQPPVPWPWYFAEGLARAAE